MLPSGAPSRRSLYLGLLLALLGVTLAAFFVLGRIDARLQREEEERLSSMARTLGLEIARRVPGSVSSTPDLLSIGARFDRARIAGETGAVFLVDREGLVAVEADESGVHLRPRLWGQEERRSSKGVWSGFEVYVPATGAGRRDGGALLYPIFEMDGNVTHAIGILAGATFRDRLNRLAPMILLSRAIGAALLLLVVVFLLWMLRQSVRELRRPDNLTDVASSKGGHDTQFMLDTFHEIVSNMKESQSELRTLYSRAEERAVYLEKVVAYMLRSLPTGVIIFDQERRVLLINGAARTILRLPSRQFIGERAEVVFAGSAEWLGHLDALLSGAKTHSRFEMRTSKDGDEETWVGLASSLIRDPRGDVLGGAFLLTDLTETKQLRQRLALKERLAAMGEVSSGIAHELRNSLATILGYCRLLERETVPAARAHGYLDKLRSEVRALEETSEGLLDLVRVGRRRPAEIDSEKLVRDALEAVEERMSERTPKNVTVQTAFAARGARVDADATALRKALENVIENGFQAMQEGGTMILGTRVLGAARDARADAASGGALVEIVIADSGPGLAPEVLAQIFTPFFTTKRRGTGLGLAIAQKTIAEHDGTIRATSEPGRGTRFRILLPCVSALRDAAGVAVHEEVAR
ncbi:MAG: two-component system sensor histidine kinase NtrB [bacterium]